MMCNDTETRRFQTPEVLFTVGWMWVETFLLAFEVSARTLCIINSLKNLLDYLSNQKITGVVGGGGVVVFPAFFASGFLVVVCDCCLRLFVPLWDFFCTPFLFTNMRCVKNLFRRWKSLKFFWQTIYVLETIQIWFLCRFNQWIRFSIA